MIQNDIFFGRHKRNKFGEIFTKRYSFCKQSRTAVITAEGSSTEVGIFKTLSSMGSATKKNLSSLAHVFSTKSTAAQRRSSRGDELGTARETRLYKPLVEFEVVRTVHISC
jgi:hypothetical protein